jgi:hypothetical protein
MVAAKHRGSPELEPAVQKLSQKRLKIRAQVEANIKQFLENNKKVCSQSGAGHTNKSS